MLKALREYSFEVILARNHQSVGSKIRTSTMRVPAAEETHQQISRMIDNALSLLHPCQESVVEVRRRGTNGPRRSIAGMKRYRDAGSISTRKFFRNARTSLVTSEEHKYVLPSWVISSVLQFALLSTVPFHGYSKWPDSAYLRCFDESFFAKNGLALFRRRHGSLDQQQSTLALERCSAVEVEDNSVAAGSWRNAIADVGTFLSRGWGSYSNPGRDDEEKERVDSECDRGNNWIANTDVVISIVGSSNGNFLLYDNRNCGDIRDLTIDDSGRGSSCGSGGCVNNGDAGIDYGDEFDEDLQFPDVSIYLQQQRRQGDSSSQNQLRILRDSEATGARGKNLFDIRRSLAIFEVARCRQSFMAYNINKKRVTCRPSKLEWILSF